MWMGFVKAVILAGGFGTRISELTENLPKPMIEIGGKPILIHVMSHFARFGIKEFVIAAGYKAEKIKEFFLNYSSRNSDFEVTLSNGQIRHLGPATLPDWKVTVVDTGLQTMTGGRLKRLQYLLQDGTFFVTYGDGISDVNLGDLLVEHQSSGNLATVTAVRPPARFGNLNITKGSVTRFQEKSQADAGWINGGFIAMEPQFLEFIAGDDAILEGFPMEHCADIGRLGAWKHTGFWQCMDTKRDFDLLQGLFESGSLPSAQEE